MASSYVGDEVAVFYVDGESGSDSNSDTDAKTLGTAWQTIDHAFTRIASGDVGSPSDGDEIRIVATSNDRSYYSETVTHELDWSSKEVSITGANDSGVVDGTRPTIYGTDLGSGENSIWEINVNSADAVTISNLVFDGGDAANCHHCIHHSAANSHNIRWVNCRFSQAADHGYDLDGNSNYLSYINCQFDNNGGDGLHQNSTFFGLIYRCLFNDNATNGAYISGSSRITQSVFYNNGTDGLRASTGGATICGCVFEDNTSDGIYFPSGTGTAVLTDCVMTGNQWGINAASSAEVHCFNCHAHGNASGSKYIGATDHVIMHDNFTASDPGWESEATFDFTPTGSSALVGGGLPTPFLYMGSTSADAGINKFRTSPYQIHAGRPRRY